MQSPQQVQLLGVVVDLLRQGGAHTEPARQQEPALGPAEHPGDRPQTGEIPGAGLAAGRTAGDLQLADLLDRGDLLEKRHQIGVVVNQGPVMLAGALGHAAHQLVPARGGIQLVGHQAVLHHRRRDGFQVVKGKFRQAVLGGQHFTLFGDLDPALQCAAGLGKDGLVGRAAAAAHRSTPAVEQP